MNYRVLLPAVALTILCALLTSRGFSLEDEFSSSLEVRYELRGSWKFERSDGQSTIEFCPDNTCRSFIFPSHLDEEKSFDFVYLYFVLVQGNYLIENFGDQQPKSNVRDVIERYAHRCPEYVWSARCILTSLAELQQIQIVSVRYDEMDRHEVHLELNDQLARLIPRHLERFGLNN